jgi:hypothetical protein
VRGRYGSARCSSQAASARHVGHVLEHLGGHGGVDRTVRQGEPFGGAVDDLEVDATRAGDLAHARARVDGDDPGPFGRQLRSQEAGSGPDVHNVLTGSRGEQAAHLLALGDDIGRGVRRLDPAGGLGVELQHEGQRAASRSS